MSADRKRFQSGQEIFEAFIPGYSRSREAREGENDWEREETAAVEFARGLLKDFEEAVTAIRKNQR